MSRLADGLPIGVSFIVKNITMPPGRSIKVFNTPIRPGFSLDLMKIPGISEEDIRVSLLKGDLGRKITNRQLQLVSSTLSLAEFDPTFISFLSSAGLTSRNGSFSIPQYPDTIIVWAPGLSNPTPPIYSNWSDIENAVNAYQGAVHLLIDMTNVQTPYPHVPSTANLDGQGRLSITGIGPQAEAGIIIDDGGQIKNVQEWNRMVVKCTPTIRPSIVYDISGMVVYAYDATFFYGGVSTQPLIYAPANSIPSNTYIVFQFINSAFFNSHSPSQAVLNAGPNVVLIMAIVFNMFPPAFNGTISGPVSASFQLSRDASQPPITLPGFLGSTSDTLIDDAMNINYTPASTPNWNNSPPSTIKQALDRIAAKIGPIS